VGPPISAEPPHGASLWGAEALLEGDAAVPWPGGFKKFTSRGKAAGPTCPIVSKRATPAIGEAVGMGAAWTTAQTPSASIASTAGRADTHRPGCFERLQRLRAEDSRPTPEQHRIALGRFQRGRVLHANDLSAFAFDASASASAVAPLHPSPLHRTTAWLIARGTALASPPPFEEIDPFRRTNSKAAWLFLKEHGAAWGASRLLELG